MFPFANVKLSVIQYNLVRILSSSVGTGILRAVEYIYSIIVEIGVNTSK